MTQKINAVPCPTEGSSQMVVVFLEVFFVPYTRGARAKLTVFFCFWSQQEFLFILSAVVILLHVVFLNFYDNISFVFIPPLQIPTELCYCISLTLVFWLLDSCHIFKIERKFRMKNIPSEDCFIFNITGLEWYR